MAGVFSRWPALPSSECTSCAGHILDVQPPLPMQFLLFNVMAEPSPKAAPEITAPTGGMMCLPPGPCGRRGFLKGEWGCHKG